MASTLRRLRLITFTIDAATAIARSREMFAAEGLELDITITPNSTNQMRGLSAGTWDIASTGFDNVLAWSGREGAEIVALAQADGKIFLPVYVRPEIRDWNDLRGRRVAVDAVDTAYALVLRRILLAHGLDLKRGDYELVGVGAAGFRLESLKRSDTFASILNRPWDVRATSEGMVHFGDHSEVLPDYPGGVFAVTRAWAQGHRDELVIFLRTWLSALRCANDLGNREETIRLVAAPFEEHLGDRRLSHEAAVGHLARLPEDGALDLPGLQSVLDLRVQFGLTPPMGSDLTRYYDLTYYQAAVGQ